MDFCFRKDEYKRCFYYTLNGKTKIIPYKIGKYQFSDFNFEITEKEENSILEIDIKICSNKDVFVDEFGFRLGIDCYMDKYPSWNDKLFPTALRCEKNGFWSCFISPNGKMLSVCSPSKIVSWKNEYNKNFGDVGHRIYTSSVDFININKQPKRHIISDNKITKNGINIKLFYKYVSDKKELFEFIKNYSNIYIPKISKFTLEKDEPLFIDDKKYDKDLKIGLNTIELSNNAQINVYVRKNWFYYLDAARKSAETCQQKAGSHCESYYGYFSLVEYAKVINDKEYTKNLCKKFDKFFSVITKNGVLKKKAYPNRLQNISTLISLLSSFYDLTKDLSYLDKADVLAEFLMSLQSKKDGSYRNNGVHYTCVIYPAKSMLELSIAENKANRKENSKKYYESAYKAIKNLNLLKDNIQTEGQMTFEDGMISCEVLQLAYLALLTNNEKDKIEFTKTAEFIFNKHKCLQQNILPDCRVRGCTLRFWEARYDLNFYRNMLNTPHGWTSWKNYGSYYLYLLTGKIEYLRDLMNTIGACMQCVDENGVLNWGFVLDPCVKGKCLKVNANKYQNIFEEKIVGEEYLPMISNWYRQKENKLVFQYIRCDKSKFTILKDYGGSCDNDVHEHFKCLAETVFAKSFIHEIDKENFETYNCYIKGNSFICDDEYVNKIIFYSLIDRKIEFNNKIYSVKKGLNYINV